MMGSTNEHNMPEPSHGNGPKASAIRRFCETPLAVSSWSWHAPYYAGVWSLLDLPAAAKSAGIYAIECNDFMLPPPRFSRVRRPLLSLLPGSPRELWRYSRATLRQLRERSRKHRINVLAWTVNSDFTVAAQNWPAQRLYLSRGLHAAGQLRASLIRVNLGGSPQTAMATDARTIRRLIDYVISSQRYLPGLTITVENHWGVSSDIDRHLSIVDQVAAELPPMLRRFFGCCFDPGNVADGLEKERWCRELAKRANHFHLKTTDFADDGYDEKLPYPAIIAQLQEFQYGGSTTIEYAGDGLARTGVEKSQRLFRTICTDQMS